MIPSGIITLTTDFGQRDPYVAMMKGVILSINPHARIVDITHQVPAGSIREGGTIIKEAYRYFTEGTVHLAVIDPGVGGKRRPIVALADNHFFVGPDNGLFWPVLQSQEHTEVIHLTERAYWMEKISFTFHGRDIFAPVASHLSRGVVPHLLGKRVYDPATIALPLPRSANRDLVGEIMRADHFGNLVTNITREHLSPYMESKGVTIRVGNLVLGGLSTTYSDVPEGQPLALIGSSGLLEIAINRGSASKDLAQECGVGSTVIVSWQRP